MVHHLKSCTADCINDLVTEQQDIVCPWCNDTANINTFHVHFIEAHKQVIFVNNLLLMINLTLHFEKERSNAFLEFIVLKNKKMKKCFNFFLLYCIVLQIYEVISKESEKYLCPNFNCPFVGYSLNSYQQHSVACPPCILCEDCNCTFTVYRDLTEHECLVSACLCVGVYTGFVINRRDSTLECESSLLS